MQPESTSILVKRFLLDRVVPDIKDLCRKDIVSNENRIRNGMYWMGTADDSKRGEEKKWEGMFKET